MTTSGQTSLSIQPSRAKSILSQVIACLALDLLLIDLGMSVNFVTMVMPRVLNAKEGLSINEYQATWFGSMAFLCQPLGSVFSGPLLDTLGRKKSLVIVSVPHIVAWILMYSAWDVPTLFLANALLGFGTGLMEAPSVTYVGEVSESSVRGILTTLTNGFTSTGMFVAYLLGAVLPWRHAALACLLVPVTSMILVLLVPETPIWLLSKGRQKDALKSLCRLRGWAKPEDVKPEFDNLVQYNDILQQCVICLKTEKTGYPCDHKNALFFKRTLLKIKHVFLAKETLRPFTLVMAYFFFHTMSGLAPIRPNMVNVCNALGMKNVNIVVPMIGAVFIAMSLLSALIVKLIGKRKLIIGAMLATACCSLSLSVYARMNVNPGVFSYEKETFPIEKTVLPVVLFMLLACFTALGIPWILLSEVFPFRSRGIATSLAAASNYAVFFVAAKTNFNIEAYFQLSGSFAIYSTFGFIGAVYLYFFLPETENKSLVEIEKYYQGESRIFADDILINAFRKKRNTSLEANKPMLVKQLAPNL